MANASLPFAVVHDRGRRYTVRPGDEIWIDLRAGAQAGSALVFDQVELVATSAGVKVGTPTVAGAKVEATVKGETKGEKIVVFKYRRRKSSRRRKGHRERYTRVAIQSVSA